VELKKQMHVKGQCLVEGVMKSEVVKWTIGDADEFWVV
jgi:hypothetical protein